MVWRQLGGVDDLHAVLSGSFVVGVRLLGRDAACVGHEAAADAAHRGCAARTVGAADSCA